MDTDDKKIETETPDIVPVKNKRDGDGLVSMAVLGAVIGMLVGLIPVTAWTYVCKTDFFSLYALCPLAVYLFMRLFRADYDTSSITILVFFSAFGAYLALLSCQAAYHALTFKMSVLDIPLLTVLSLGKPGVIPPYASQIVFPLIFSALGIFISIALLSLSNAGLEDKYEVEAAVSIEVDADAENS